MNNNIKQAFITVGIPGCGKSTWAANTVAAAPEDVSIAEVNLDDCRELICGDPSNQSVTADAVKLHKEMIDGLIEAQVDTIIVSDTNIALDTNLNPKFRTDLIDKFKSNGYVVNLVLFFVPFDVCMDRNNNRDRKVPEHAMIRMNDQFNYQFPNNDNKAELVIQYDV